jgi:hypothetical protein
MPLKLFTGTVKVSVHMNLSTELGDVEVKLHVICDIYMG